MKQSLKMLAVTLMTTVAAVAQGQLHEIRKTTLGGEGGWDYLTVDSQNKRLYLSHSTQVEVLDLATHAKVGTIANLRGVHGIVIVPSAGRGLTSNGRSNTVTIFDLKTLAVIAELPTGKNPDALLYDSFSSRVFAFNHSGGSATAIDIAGAKVLGTVELGGEGVEAGATDEAGTIFVNLEDKNEIVAFDATSLTVKSRWSLAPGEEPTGLALDKTTNRLFAACHNEKLMILDSKSGKVVTSVPIGKRVDGVVFDPSLRHAYTSNGEGTITVVEEVSANEFKVVETVKTEPGARTIALDPASHHVFVPTAKYGPAPEPTKENPRPRPSVVSGSFMVIELGY